MMENFKKKIIRKFWHSFPIQLFLMHVRKDQIFLFFWTVLFLVITRQIGSDLGFTSLFLDPGYLQKTNAVSMFWVGFFYGGFVITWNLSSYLLNSRRFHFLASLENPFATYVINNAILPAIFAVTYMYLMLSFQLHDEFKPSYSLAMHVLGFASGFIAMMLCCTFYFYFTNTNAFHLTAKKSEEQKRIHISKTLLAEDQVFDRYKWMRLYQVDAYLNIFLRWRAARDTHHYPEIMRIRVLNQHHINALIIQVVSITLLIILGFFMGVEWLQFPAAACIFLLFAVFISLTAFIRYWTGPWATTAVILFMISFNFLSQYGFMSWDSQAYGLHYANVKPLYQTAQLSQIASVKNVAEDKENSRQILQRWKRKQSSEKPKLIIINSSGGGFRSAYFSMRILQEGDKITHGQLMNHTAFMSGASGGVYGLSFYRELYYRKLFGDKTDIDDKQYAVMLTKDLVNAISISIVTNDIFYPVQKVKINDQYYTKDRGYMMEYQFNKNTNYLLDKPISAYYEPEQSARIPMLVASSTITNDMRKLIISPQKLSYMMKPIIKNANNTFEYDAVDMNRFFEKQDGMNLKMTSALRMNSTYPYLMPPVSMPSTPTMYLYDAGFIDNFGTEVSMRFLLAMKDWINENTSGVILVQILDHLKFEEIEKAKRQTYISRMLNPAGMIYGNVSVQQDYNFDYLIENTSDILKQPLDVVRFEYAPKEKDNGVPITMRLTKREMEDINASVLSAGNKNSFDRLRKLLDE